jgi:hypothetical protein
VHGDGFFQRVHVEAGVGGAAAVEEPLDGCVVLFADGGYEGDFHAAGVDHTDVVAGVPAGHGFRIGF